MTQKVRVVVIGGGIVGCAVLYGLAQKGWSDVILLERRQLTSGSTWHAAGNTTYFGPYPAMTRLFQNSISTYLKAESETDHSVGFHQTGSLRLAATKDDLQAFHDLTPFYKEMDIPFHVISPEEVKGVHPLLDVSNIHGAAHTPTDGHVDPSGATYAMAKAARQLGAGILTENPVLQLKRRENGWLVVAENESYLADHVVMAASFWTRELAMQIGLDLPLYALQHHEVITGPIAELAGLDAELPTVRDPAAPANIRQEKDGFLCGVYEMDPKFWAVDGIPKDFKEELLPPELDRLMPELERVIDRVPSFGTAGIKTVNNGPICYTPDGVPMLGPVNGLKGLWLASGFSIGIGTGGGAGQFLADWMVSGHPPFELPAVYPSRFPKNLGQEDALGLIKKTYERGYALK